MMECQKATVIKSLVVLILLFLNALGSFGQDLNYRHLNSNNGLPANTVYRIIQDKQGYIWMASEHGVIRFNGTQYEQFTKEDGLSDNETVVLKETSDGKVWFFGYNGTASYWLKGKIYNEKIDTALKYIKTNYTFLDVFEDPNGKKWFLNITTKIVMDSGLSIARHTEQLGAATTYYKTHGHTLLFYLWTKKVFLLNEHKALELPLLYRPRGESFSHLLSDNTLLFLSEQFLILQSDTSQKILLKLDENQRKSKTLSVCLSKDSLLWIATEFGLYCYTYPDLSKAPRMYFKPYKLTTLFVDREDNVWVNTFREGVFLIPASARKIIPVVPFPEKKSYRAYAVNQVQPGQLSIGLDHGKWLIWSKTQNKILYTSQLGTEKENCKNLYSFGNDLWTTSDLRFSHYNQQSKIEHVVPFFQENKRLPIIPVFKSFSMSNGKYFIGTKHALFEYFPDTLVGGHKHRSNNCHCFGKLFLNSQNKKFGVYHAKNQTLWMGTDSGLYSIQGGILRTHFQENALLRERINDITETEDSILLLATNGAGLLLYKNGRILQQLKKKESPGTNFCMKVLYRNKQVFLLSSDGISQFSKQGEKLLELYRPEFLRSQMKQQINDFYVTDKELGLAANNGVFLIPIDFLNIREAPPIYLEKVTAGETGLSIDLQNELPYWKNKLNISYSALHFQNPEALNYRYRIRSDQTWTYTTENRLELPFLKPGKYHFEVAARIGNGPWSNDIGFLFSIRPPFWETTWFLFLTAALLATAISIFIQLRFNQERKKQLEKEKTSKRISEMEQQALLTMMNPHFLFNAMNAIQRFINSNRLKEANQYLSDFARLIRMNLDISYKKYIALGEETEYLNLYLHFEKLRYEEKLEFEITISEEAEEMEGLIPAMMIQPFVENAIWHGLGSLEKGGKIKIQLQMETEYMLRVCIEDNGMGIKEEYLHLKNKTENAKAGGLAITLQRLCLLHDSDDIHQLIQFAHINPDQPNKGTRVNFILPVKNK